MDIDRDFIKEEVEPMVDELGESELYELIKEHSSYSPENIDDKARCVKENLHGDYLFVLYLLKDLDVNTVPVYVDCHRCEGQDLETILAFQEDELNCPVCGAVVFEPIP